MVLLAVVTSVAALLLIAGCGGATTDAPEHPFGAQPASAPGVRAWAAGEVGTLLVTGDGGANWRRQPFYLSARGLDVAFPQAETGWLITDSGAVLRTIDSGATWDVKQVFKLQLKAVAAVDEATAWVIASAGAAGDPGASVLLRTSDGGGSWLRAAAFGNSQLTDVAFADARRGVLVALDRIWTTRDGGRRWRLSRRIGMTVLTSACAGREGAAWVAGWGTQDGAPLVLATEDGGGSWREIKIGVQAPAAGALQAGQIVAAGPAHLWLTCPAGVLASSDAGKTWELQKAPAGQPVAIAAADDRHLLATTGGQPVLATADGGAVWRAWGSDGFLAQPLVAVAAVAAPADQ